LQCPGGCHHSGTPAFNIVANFCNENPGFTRMLTTVSARFNPIATYHKNPHKAFEMAANGDAENVFEGMTPPDYVRNGGVRERIIPYGGPEAEARRPIARRSRHRGCAGLPNRVDHVTQGARPKRSSFQSTRVLPGWIVRWGTVDLDRAALRIVQQTKSGLRFKLPIMPAPPHSRTSRSRNCAD
jgi:hypothetical protein